MTLQNDLDYSKHNPISFNHHAILFGYYPGFAPPNPVPCREPLGMEDKTIKDKALKSSSNMNDNFKPENGRLNSKTYCWSPGPADSHQWFQVSS